MNKCLFFSVLIGALVMPIQHSDTEYRPQIAIEDDIYMGGQLPQYGKLCYSADVRGGPDEIVYEVIETLPVGTVVSLHELSKPDGTWVMIQRARWIPLRAICKWN